MRKYIFFILLWILLKTARSTDSGLVAVKIVEKGGELPFREGENVTLPCQATGGPNLQIEWHKDGSKVVVLPERYYMVNNTLRITNFDPRTDIGLYGCQAHDGVGSTQITYFLTSPGAPRWLRPQQMVHHKSSNALDKVELECPAEGDPRPNIAWYREGKLFKERYAGKISRNDTVNRIRLNEVTDYDAGDYTCVLSNNKGTIRFHFDVRVQHRERKAPYIFSPNSSDITAHVGDEVKVICKYNSDTQPFLVWYRKVKVRMPGEGGIEGRESDLRQNEGLQLQKSKDAETIIPIWSHDDKTHHDVLVLKNVNQSYSGIYGCLVGNAIGNSTKEFFLNIIDRKAVGYRKDVIVLLAVVIFLVIVIALISAILTRQPNFYKTGCSSFLSSCGISRSNPDNGDGSVSAKDGSSPWKLRQQVLMMRSNFLYPMSKGTSVSREHSFTPLMFGEKPPYKNRKTWWGKVVSPGTPSNYGQCVYPTDQWEIPRISLVIGKVLGEGAFGIVLKAEVKDLKSPDKSDGCNMEVAIKTIKEGATMKDYNDLMQELEVMKTIGQHQNIINLIGCCTREDPPLVIVEYARYGNLRDFLRERRPSATDAAAAVAAAASLFGCSLPTKSPWTIADRTTANNLLRTPTRYSCKRHLELILSQSLTSSSPPPPPCKPSTEDGEIFPLTFTNLLSCAFQVARGMEYLASRMCIHRDLAARNVLVSSDWTIKLADFGLSRNIYNRDYYRKLTDGRLPVKWMAPEALFDRKYTTKSDVWSYGVLLWEIFTLGGTPYPSVPVEKIFGLLKEGHRMEKPPHASLELYSLMLDCWSDNPFNRPTFVDIVNKLDHILVLCVSQDYLDLDLISKSSGLFDSQYVSMATSTTDTATNSSHSQPQSTPPYLRASQSGGGVRNKYYPESPV